MSLRRRSTAATLAHTLVLALVPPSSASLLTVGAVAALPLITALPAAAQDPLQDQDFSEEYNWPSSQSKITGVKMPPHTTRLASAKTSYPNGVILRMMSNGKTAGMQVDRREEFFWTGLKPAQLKSERDTFFKNLTAAGYTVKPLTEEDHPQEHIIFFVAQKKGSTGGNGTVPGFWSVGEDFQALVLGAAAGVLGPKVVAKVYTEKEKQGFALIDAVEKKNVNEVKALLAKGVDVNSRSKFGQTPLMRAAMNYQDELAKVLLEAGADPNIGTDDMNPLLIASMGQQLDLIDLLLQYKANINLATPDGGYTALHVAAMLGKEGSVEKLLEKGIDTKLRTKDGRTAEEMAQRNKHDAIAQKIRAAADKG